MTAFDFACVAVGAGFLLFAGSVASDSIRHWHDYLRWLRERKPQP